MRNTKERPPDETTRGADEKPGCVLLGVGLLGLAGGAILYGSASVLVEGGMGVGGLIVGLPLLLILGVALLVAAAARSVPSVAVRAVLGIVGVLDLALAAWIVWLR